MDQLLPFYAVCYFTFADELARHILAPPSLVHQLVSHVGQCCCFSMAWTCINTVTLENVMIAVFMINIFENCNFAIWLRKLPFDHMHGAILLPYWWCFKLADWWLLDDLLLLPVLMIIFPLKFWYDIWCMLDWNIFAYQWCFSHVY